MFYFDFPRRSPPSPRRGFYAHPSPISELSRSFAGQGDRGNKYQYNGIELIDDFGLNANHALYRTLDPQLGRWWQIDPKAEEFYAWSPYHSNLGNPVRYQDPEGDACIPCAIVGAIAEATATAYDAYDAYQTVTDSKTSTVEKVVAVVGAAAGTVLPGGGYGKAGKAVVNALEGGKDAGKAVDKAKAVHKNANDAEGNFVLYEVRDTDGSILKVGKANGDDVMKGSGDVRRAHTSEKKAQQAGYPKAKSTVTDKLGQTTTKEAKKAEAAKVRTYREQGHKLPLNKEKDKNYIPK